MTSDLAVNRPLKTRRFLAYITAAATLISGLALFAAEPASAASALAVGSLTTNGRIDPLGIPGSDPVFGWALDSTGRAVTQSAYEIEVGSNPGGNDVWGSGKVESSAQVDIAYGGPDLLSGTEYFWRVRAWDGADVESAWSEPASFETGLLAASDWGGAKWIGKTAAYSAWTDYTTTLDFDVNSEAFGIFLRAADTNNAYMWQLNLGTTAASVPRLRPHLRVNGGYSLLGEVDLRPFGFTRDSLLNGVHRLSFKATGNTIETTLDGTVVDTRSVTNFATGGVGVRTFGGESVTLSSIKVTKSDGTVLANPAFSEGNPLTGGTHANGQVTVAGTVDAVLKTGELNAPLFRTSFDVDPQKTVASARVYASAHGVYELSLNGEKVGDQFLAPGYTEYAKRIQSQTYDVTDLVRAGANGFGAAVGDGWWAGKVGLAGKYQYGRDLSVVARLKISYTDGSTQWVDTDTGWKWASGPYVATDNQLGETYDARSERPGWTNGDYTAAGWSPVRELPSDTAKLAPQPDEPVRETEVLDTIALTEPVAGVKVYDLGQNMVGVPRVTITGKAGETVKLRHAEVLNPDGTLYTANLRAALATDHYTFAADGTITYRPTFTQHGFRYIEVTGLSQPPAAADVKGVVLGSDLRRTGTLETSNGMLNQLLSNVSWGARGNFLSIPTDTPARDERLGWTGDINIFAPTAGYLFDTRSFLGKWMVDVRDEQKASGSIPSVIPSTNGAFSETGVHWEDAIITVPYSLWNAHGNRQVVEHNWDAMKKFFDYARASAGADHLEPGRATWFSGDWLHLDDPSNQGVLGTAAWAQDVRMMSEMAAAIGHDAEAAEYAALYENVRTAFTAAYVAPDGTVAGNSQTGYALALGMDLITNDDLQRKAGEKFVAKLATTDNHLRTGFVGTPWLLPALSNIDRDDLAYTLLLKETYPSWGYEISKGATTIWERWNSIQPDGSFGPVDMNSFNHYAYGAVADWMHQNIGGIKIKEAGYRSSIIEPRPGGGLTEASGQIDTVYGTLSSAWKLADGRLTLDVTVPVNTTAEVRIPSTSRWAVTEGDQLLDSVDGVLSVERNSDDGLTVVTVGSGTYSFATSDRESATIAILDQLHDLQAAVDDAEGIGDGDRAHLTEELNGATESVGAALRQLLAADPSSALVSLREVLGAVEALRAWLVDSGIAEDLAASLDAQLLAIEVALQTKITAVAGISTTFPALSDSVPLGDVARGVITVKNDGSEPIDAISGTVTVEGLADEPVNVGAGAVAPGAEARIEFDIPVRSSARVGAYDAELDLTYSTADGDLRHRSVVTEWVKVRADVSIASISVEPPVSGVTNLVVTVSNAGSVPVTGRIVPTSPEGWSSTPSPLARFDAGTSAVVRVPVSFPLDSRAGAYPVSVALVDRGAALAEAQTQVTVPELSVPPSEPVADHVDFGDPTSETAHAVAASPTSGTSSEAGFTRRYAHNNTPGSWYSARVEVPAGHPFLLRMRETWNSGGTKDYDIYVDDVLVRHVNVVRSAGGQGTTNHQVLVTDPGALNHDGSVTVKFMYPATNAPFQYYDPSIADLWVIGSPDLVAPAVSATPDDEAKLGDNGWYRSAVDVTVDAGDNVDTDPLVEYWADGQWTEYTGPVAFEGDGSHEFRYRAADRSGNSSGVELLMVRIDRTAPEVGLVGGPEGDVAFGDVPAAPTCEAEDATSGVRSCRVEGYDTALGSHTLTAIAVDNAGNTAVVTREYSVKDLTAPTVTVSDDLVATATGASGAAVSFDAATATDDVDGPVGVTCDRESASVFPVGTTEVTCTAADSAGNAGEASFNITVRYDWAGFFAPIDTAGPGEPPVYNSVKAGAAVPVRFTLGGDMGLGVLAAGSPTSKAISCVPQSSIDPLEETVTASRSSLRYDAGVYVYNWKTDKAFKGCRELTVILIDGTKHTALFTFVK